MKRFILYGLIALVIAAAGFGGGWLVATSRPVPTQPQAELPAPSPVEASLKDHALWGMTLGSRRVYVDGDKKETMTVKAIRVDNEKAIYTLVTVDERGNADYQDVYQDIEGVWIVHGDPDIREDHERRLRLPCREGDRWSSSRSLDLGVNYTCHGIESVIVPAGTFEAIKVSAVMSHIRGPTRYEAYWYSSEHGLIQYEIRLEGFQAPSLPDPPPVASIVPPSTISRCFKLSTTE